MILRDGLGPYSSPIMEGSFNGLGFITTTSTTILNTLDTLSTPDTLNILNILNTSTFITVKNSLTLCWNPLTYY